MTDRFVTSAFFASPLSGRVWYGSLQVQLCSRLSAADAPELIRANLAGLPSVCNDFQGWFYNGLLDSSTSFPTAVAELHDSAGGYNIATGSECQGPSFQPA